MHNLGLSMKLNYFIPFIVFANLSLLAAAKSETKPLSAEIIKEGYIECFKDSYRNSKGEIQFCEASGVVFDSKSLIIASDKVIPKKSSVFKISYPIKGKTNIEKYFSHEFIKNSSKIEDLSISPDRKFIFATTAFDRKMKNSDKWDSYNIFLYWKTGFEDKPTVISPSKGEKPVTSIPLRKHFGKILKTAYYKIEGLAILPKNKILFGVRSLGKSYKNFNFTIKILQVSYDLQNGNLKLKDEAK